MPYKTEILFVLIALIAEVLGTVAGFGSSVFFVPVAQLLLDFHAVLMLTALLHVVGNTSKVILFWRHIQWKLLLRFAIPSIVLTLLGAWLTDVLNLPWIELVLSVFLVVLSTVYLVRPHIRIKPTVANSVVVGGVSGFLTGLTGTGGAIRAAGLAGFELSKELFVATSAAIDWGNDAGRAVVYLAKGYLRPELYIYLPLLFGVGILGTWLGKKLLARLSQKGFRRIVLWVILAIGVFTLVRAISAQE